MIDYTKVALKKIFDDFKQFVYVFQVCVYILYTLYLIYAIITKSGILAVNILLLIFSIAYLIFFIVYNERKQKNKAFYSFIHFLLRGPLLFLRGQASSPSHLRAYRRQFP